MNATISAGQLRQHLADTLNRASYAKDRTVVERNGKPVADEAKAEGGALPPSDSLRELREGEKPAAG